MCVPTDDVQSDIIVSFEFVEYSVGEGEPTVEVCLVTSSTPAPGQTVSAEVSTQDGTAMGIL